jgi:hypothetical protein
MPLEKPEDHAQGNPNAIHCRHCMHADGTLKSYEQILEETAAYFVHSQGIDPQAARKMTETVLSQLPSWRDRK